MLREQSDPSWAAVLAFYSALHLVSAWAVEDTKRALRGEKTMTDIATDYWSKNGIAKTFSDLAWQIRN